MHAEKFCAVFMIHLHFKFQRVYKSTDTQTTSSSFVVPLTWNTHLFFFSDHHCKQFVCMTVVLHSFVVLKKKMVCFCFFFLHEQELSVVHA